jgi:SAM-dependent methyltransferase
MGVNESFFKSDPPTISIAPTEKRKYEMMWDFPEYRCVAPGERTASMFLKAAKPKPGSEVIDFGCGTGRGALMLAILGNCKVTMLDFARNCLDEEIKQALTTQSHMLSFVEQDLSKPISSQAQYGFCCDVMEHIPPQQVDIVLSNILKSAQHVFFAIALYDDRHGRELIGHPLHLSVHDAKWWLDKLQEHDCMMHWMATAQDDQENDGYAYFYVSAWANGKEIASTGKLNTIPDELMANMKANIEAGWSQVTPHETNDMEAMILCGGPSLAEFEDDIRAKREAGMPLITVNGTYNWAIEHGLKPSAQIVVDGREFNKRFVSPLVDMCRYLIASQCNPAVLDGLPKDRTLLWHTGVNGDAETMLDEHYKGQWFPIPGGSTVMLRSIPLLRVLGWRRLHVYGFDSCLMDGKHHSYAQAENDNDLPIGACVGDRVFQCHGWMVAQAQEFIDLVTFLGDEVELEVYGDGMIAHILKTGAALTEET